MANNNNNPIQPQIDIQKHLEGMDYPARKQDLMEHAQSQGAPDEVMGMLEDLPDQKYDGPTDVTKAVSQGK